MECIVKFLNKSLIVSLFIFFTSQSMAVTVSDGVNASNSNDLAVAVKIWTKLANSGNMIAQYNLANHYSSGKGVQQNSALAEQWLKDATHSGLVQAYLKLNRKAITSAKGMSLSFNISPSAWLGKQESNKYYVQKIIQ